MKSFRQYLSEVPIDLPLETRVGKQISNALDITGGQQNSLLANVIIKTFGDYARKKKPAYPVIDVGNGAFRKPILMPVNLKRFSNSPQTLQPVLNAIKDDKVAKTVIKVARPENKAANISSYDFNSSRRQNYNEWATWERFKDDPIISKYLCPVLDTSASIFPQLKEDENTGFLFNQMPLCDVKMVGIAMSEEFGYWEDNLDRSVYNFSKTFFRDVAYNNPMAGSSVMFPRRPNEFNKVPLDTIRKTLASFRYKENKDLKVTNKQLQNLKELIYTIKTLALDDLHKGNFGVLGERVVIIDYADPSS